MPARPLVAVMGCGGYMHRIDEIRNTWLRHAEGVIDVRFFLGSTATSTNPDTIILDVPDDYVSLPLKVQQTFSWALTQGYGHVFKTDDDTLVDPRRLFLSGYQKHDYIGRWNAGAPCEYYDPVQGWASGGPGYWVSARAMKFIVNSTWNNDWAEDRWNGQTLHAAGIECFEDSRYTLYPWYRDTRTAFCTACNVSTNLIGEKRIPESSTVTLTQMYTWWNKTGTLPEVVVPQSSFGIRRRT